jgi:hypothetical protein
MKTVEDVMGRIVRGRKGRGPFKVGREGAGLVSLSLARCREGMSWRVGTQEGKSEGEEAMN